MRDRFAGVMQTIWSPADDPLDQYYGRRVPPVENEYGGDPIECTQTVFAGFRKLGR
jgi:hypothetical protein